MAEWTSCRLLSIIFESVYYQSFSSAPFTNYTPVCLLPIILQSVFYQIFSSASFTNYTPVCLLPIIFFRISQIRPLPLEENGKRQTEVKFGPVRLSAKSASLAFTTSEIFLSLTLTNYIWCKSVVGSLKNSFCSIVQHIFQ